MSRNDISNFQQLKLDAVKYKGGKCIRCGYNKCLAALTFHHRNPSEKRYNWNQLKRRSWVAIRQELSKCDLMCCRCHTELEEQLKVNSFRFKHRSTTSI